MSASDIWARLERLHAVQCDARCKKCGRKNKLMWTEGSFEFLHGCRCSSCKEERA